MPFALAIALLLAFAAQLERQSADSLPAARGEPCTVARVFDGDTFTCGNGLRVRLIGIDSPELAQGAGAREARDALARWLPRGRVVRLERDVTLTDQYGRRLAYIWAADTLVDEAMVSEGWAVLLTVPPNVKYVERLRAAEQAARHARAGLWATNAFECQPVDFRRRKC